MKMELNNLSSRDSYENNKYKNNDSDNNLDQSIDSARLKKYRLRFILNLILIIACIPLALYVVISLLAGLTGFRILDSSYYGFDAIYAAFYVYGFLFGYLFILCVVVATVTLIYFVKTKTLYEKDEQKKYYRYILKKLALPVGILVGALLMVFLCAAFLQSTLEGAKIKVTLGMKNVRGTYTVESILDNEPVHAIAKNGDVVSVFDSQLDHDASLDFMDKVYYHKYCTNKNTKYYVDLDLADQYQFMDDGGIYMETMYLKDGIIRIGESDESYDLYIPIGNK